MVGGGGGHSRYIQVGVCRGTSKRGILGTGTTPKRGDLGTDTTPKRGVLGTGMSRRGGGGS